MLYTTDAVVQAVTQISNTFDHKKRASRHESKRQEDDPRARPEAITQYAGKIINHTEEKITPMPKLFHPLLNVDEDYLRSRAESIDVYLTDEQLIEAASTLEKVFERGKVVSDINEMAEKVIEDISGQS